VLSRAQSFLDPAFWMQTAVPAAGGFIGTKMVGGIIHGVVSKFAGSPMGIAGTVLRLGSDVLAASGLSYLAGRFLGRKYGEAIFVGGVVGITHSVLRELLGGTAIGSAIGLSGLGADVEDRMREQVARRVEAELSGMGAYLTQDALTPQALHGGMGAYLTERDMVPQVPDTLLRSSAAFAPSPSAGVADYDPLNERLEL
jgi:hypothetical protein